MEEYYKNRSKLIKENEELNFSNDIKLNKKELELNNKLLREVKKFNEENKNLSYHNYLEFKKNIENSSIYSFVNNMPKGGIHHFHNESAIDYDLVYEFCDEDLVYFNMKNKIFKIIPNNKNIEVDGFIKTKYLKKTMGEKFSNFLKNNLTMSLDEMSQGDPTDIFEKFQNKFMMTSELYFFKPFFLKLMKNSIDILLEQKVYIQEWRYVFSSVFDENHHLLIDEEFELLKELIDYGKRKNPYFEFSIITCGLKIFGKDHILKMLDVYHKYKNVHKFMIGFDLVCDEDKFLDLDEYIKIIKDYEIENNVKTIFYIHAGESYKRKNKNLIDAYLIEAKRIGHGIALAYFPDIVEKIKENDVCIESNPISNFLLGYVPNLKNHPLKNLIQNGLQISISPDDYGFFGYKGVTLDYAFVLSQWELDLKDLKKLGLNSIKYSRDSIDKELHYKKFNEDWENFVETELSKLN